jgi:hypothetical protein
MGSTLSTIQRQQIGTIRLLELNNLENKNNTEFDLNNQIEQYYPEKRDTLINELIIELEKNPDNVLDINGMLSSNSIFVEDIIIKYNEASIKYQNMLKEPINELHNQLGGHSKKKKSIIKLYSSRPLRFRKYDF